MATALVLAVLATVFNIAFGLFILVRNPRMLNARIFFGLTVVISAWIVANALTSYYLGSVFLVEIANSLSYALAYMAMILGLIFTYNFPQKRKIPKSEAVFVIVLSLVVILLALTPLVSGDVMVDEASGIIKYRSGELLFIYAIAIVSIFVIVIRNLIDTGKKASHFVIRQSRQILLAFSLTVLFALFINVIAPLMGLGWDFTRLTPLTTIIFVGVVAYSIVKSGLFDMRVAIIRSFAYVLTFALLVAIYYGGAYVLTQIFMTGSRGLFSDGSVSMLLALVLAVIFQPIQSAFDSLTNRIFYRGKRNHEELQTAVSRVISDKTSIGDVMKHLNAEIISKIGAESSIMATMGAGGLIQKSQGDIGPIDLNSYEALESLSGSGEPVVINHLSSTVMDKIASKMKIVIYMPLMYGGRYIGLLGLGDHKSNAYNDKDMAALKNVSIEIAVAIQNAHSLDKINNFNIELKDEIARATSDLRASNRKLKAMDQMKDEFISLTSHQLRTPLTTIKGYLSMLMDGDAGKITPTQQKLINEAFNSSQRMVHLINDFLNISRIQTGKFMIELTDVNLADILDEEIEQLKISAASRQIKLVHDRSVNFPTMPIDEGKIRQVMMNFIDNAIYYSPASSEINIVLSHTTSTVEFKVIDHGIGVPKDEQHKLFNKFSRASNARKQRPDGTGIGLFMAKKVVVALGGSIIFESKEGKGSTFGFRLNRPS